ncbi:MAG: VWA domain-containing protein [Promethearchaeota archaeon]
MNKKIIIPTIIAMSLLFSFVMIPLNVSAATEEDIEDAIEYGINYLISQQDPSGSWDYNGWPDPGVTGFVLIKLQDRAYELGLDPFETDNLEPDYYEYADEVILGWNYLLNYFIKRPISDSYGSDTNMNGWGISVGDNDYYTGISLMSLAATGPIGLTRPNEAGLDFDGLGGADTYGEIIQEVVDWLCWAQIDSGVRLGAWGYTANSGGDNSVTGYAVLGLAAAEGYGCTIPLAVKSKLNTWIDYIQNDPGPGDDGGQPTPDGGSGYYQPTDWVNELKTGNLIFEMKFCGEGPGVARFDNALDYIERHWHDTDYQPGWGYLQGPPAHYQAMYCLMKGLEYCGIDLLDLDGVGDPEHDWYQEFADVLIAHQNPDGSWDSSPSYVWPGGSWGSMSGNVLSTAWNLLNLEKIAPPPPVEILPPEVRKTVLPKEIIFGTGDMATVTINVTGAGGTETTITPMDVVFAIDSSGSMSWNDPANLRLAAAKDFIDKMVDTRDQGSVVDWDSTVHTPQTYGLTQDFTTLKNRIDLIDSSGGTNLNAGLLGAIAMLDANPRVGPSSEIIIFLTDGWSSYYTPSGSPGSPADDAANKGYVIYSIGLQGDDPINFAPLQDMADATGGEYYSAPSPENLDEIYDAIYEEIVSSTIPHFVNVTEVTQSYIVVDESSFNIDPDSISHNLDGTTIIFWENIGMYADDDPDLSADETVLLSFDIKSKICGDDLEVDVEGEAIVEYGDYEGNYIGFVDIPQAYITVHPFVTDLIAGGGNPKSAIDVGEIIIWTDDPDFLYITYVTTDGWFMTETHLHVADSLDGIPQTKNNNPIPGHFDYQMEHAPPVQEYTYTISWDWDPGTTLYIAAHAIVQEFYVICDEVYTNIETAWGYGPGFEGKNWATYIVFEDP